MNIIRHQKLIACLILLSTVGCAQQLGHYLQGVTGLGSGSTPPPGIYLTYLPYFWRVTSVRGPGGDTVINSRLNVWANVAAATFIIPDKLYDFDFGFSVQAPWASNRIQANVLPIDRRTAGYSDTFVTPFMLGWHKGRANYMASYTFVAPTGSFDPNSAVNPGLGFWSHLFQAGTTVMLGKSRMWNVTVVGTGEIDTKKKGVDLTVGPSLTLEYGFGRHFRKGLINVGVSGHYVQKLVADYGNDVSPAIRGLKDRAIGLGPEFQWIFPKAKMSFTARYQPQFEVRNRVRGDIFVINLTYMGMFKP